MEVPVVKRKEYQVWFELGKYENTFTI
jgi:hypothetical protein